jgi:hypothetical protein
MTSSYCSTSMYVTKRARSVILYEVSLHVNEFISFFLNFGVWRPGPPTPRHPAPASLRALVSSCPRASPFFSSSTKFANTKTLIFCRSRQMYMYMYVHTKLKLYDTMHSRLRARGLYRNTPLRGRNSRATASTCTLILEENSAILNSSSGSNCTCTCTVCSSRSLRIARPSI